MKKTLLIALLAAALLGLAPPSAVAEGEQQGQQNCPPGVSKPPPGCDCKVLEAQKNQANMNRVIKKGTHNQVAAEKQESVEKLACLDQALAKITGSLGSLFSNMALDPSVTPGANNSAFCGLVSYPSLPTVNLAGHLGAMIPDLMSLIPAYQIQLCTPNPPSLPAPHIGIGGSIGGCSIAASIGSLLPKLPPPKCLKITTPGMNCMAIKSKWKGYKGSIKENGIVEGAPYPSFKDMADAAIDQNDADLQKFGDKYLKQIEANKGVLANAYNDQKDWSEPGHTRHWKKAPSFGEDATIEEIIEEIKKDPSTTASAGASATPPICPPVSGTTPSGGGLLPPLQNVINAGNQYVDNFLAALTPQFPPPEQLPIKPWSKGDGFSWGGQNILQQLVPGVNCTPGPGESVLTPPPAP